MFNNKLRNIIKHPLMGFMVLIFILTVAQLLYFRGVVQISTMRAIGQTVIFTIIGLGFAILLGYAGLASLGTAGFVGLGAYIAGNFLKDQKIPLILIFIIIIVVAIILGGIVGFISLRIEGMYLAIITLGLSEILLKLFENWTKYTGGSTGLTGIKYPKLLMSIQLTRETTFFLLLFMLLITLILTYNIINSPTGRAMLAMKNSESAAQSMGISTLKYRLLAFILATVYAMIGGALSATYMRASNTSSWTLGLSLNILAAVILGGSRSIWGVIAGSFIIFGLDLAVLQNIAYFQTNGNAKLIFSGSLIILIVMFYPGGLVRLYYDIKMWLIKVRSRRKKHAYENAN